MARGPRAAMPSELAENSRPNHMGASPELTDTGSRAQQMYRHRQRVAEVTDEAEKPKEQSALQQLRDLLKKLF